MDDYFLCLCDLCDLSVLCESNWATGTLRPSAQSFFGVSCFAWPALTPNSEDPKRLRPRGLCQLSITDQIGCELHHLFAGRESQLFFNMSVMGFDCFHTQSQVLSD